ncbi:hypothetical protein Leryth_021804 [Lithospermum erythrorhizon]|nr:hypothetical protein Leryth_021804 [Lithospermum erythrorhizon]
MMGTDKFQGFCIDVFTAAQSLLPYGICRQKGSDWPDDDYIFKSLELYQESESKRFTLLEFKFRRREST